jgi:CHAT domain-containing protein
VQDVLSHLSSSHIVHFACHGKQDAVAPLESRLILHDGHPLKVSEIMKQPMPYASLAFLSACETAMGAEELPDEAMHLAASLLFAGFRGVVGTMWWAFCLYYTASYVLQTLQVDR